MYLAILKFMLHGQVFKCSTLNKSTLAKKLPKQSIFLFRTGWNRGWGHRCRCNWCRSSRCSCCDARCGRSRRGWWKKRGFTTTLRGAIWILSILGKSFNYLPLFVRFCGWRNSSQRSLKSFPFYILTPTPRFTIGKVGPCRVCTLAVSKHWSTCTSEWHIHIMRMHVYIRNQKVFCFIPYTHILKLSYFMISMHDITVVNSTLVSKSKPFKVDAPSTNGGTELGMGSILVVTFLQLLPQSCKPCFLSLGKIFGSLFFLTCWIPSGILKKHNKDLDTN